jgi:monovalent cation/hydrogen antiporter
MTWRRRRRRRARRSSGCAPFYTQRVQRASLIDPGGNADSARAQAALRRLRHETLSAERRALIALRNEGVISDDVFHRLAQELDIEAIRIGLGEERPAITGDRRR